MTLEIRDATTDDLPHLAHFLRCGVKWVLNAYRSGPTLLTTINGQIVSALFIGFNVNAPIPVGEIIWAYTMPFFRRRKFLRRMWETHLNRTPIAKYIACVPEKCVAMQCALKEFGYAGILEPNETITFKRGVSA